MPAGLHSLPACLPQEMGDLLRTCILPQLPEGSRCLFVTTVCGWQQCRTNSHCPCTS